MKLHLQFSIIVKFNKPIDLTRLAFDALMDMVLLLTSDNNTRFDGRGEKRRVTGNRGNAPVMELMTFHKRSIARRGISLDLYDFGTLRVVNDPRIEHHITHRSPPT